MDESRPLPASPEAERALLGAVLLNPESIHAVNEYLQPEAFHREAHGRLFRLMCEMMERGTPCETLAVVDRILQTGEAESYGGVAYVSSLPEHVPSTENVEYYAEIIRDKAIRRKLLAASQEIAEVAAHEANLEEVLDHAERKVFEASQGQIRKDWLGMSEIIDVEFRRIQDLAERRQAVTGITTGFVDLDRILSGWQRSDLIILAARPAMGKTALALNLLRHAAVEGGVAVGMFSLEMPRGQLVTRMLCAEARVDAGKVRSGFLSRQDDWPRLVEAAEVLYHKPIFIDDTPALTVTQVRSKTRRLKSEHPDLGLVVVDYLQLMQGSGGPRESREQAISSISRGLKGLAKELDVPVIALSQLNRGVEARNDKRPQLSDLRESGAIEQDADIILFIYRDEYYNKDSADVGVAEVIVAKQRNGATGTVKLAFQGQLLRFDNLDQRGDGFGYE